MNALALFASHQLTRLGPVDILILVLYFAVVLFIGFYVKGSTNTSAAGSSLPVTGYSEFPDYERGARWFPRADRQEQKL